MRRRTNIGLSRYDFPTFYDYKVALAIRKDRMQRQILAKDLDKTIFTAGERGEGAQQAEYDEGYIL